MYVTGENPLLSEPDLNHAEEMFKKLDFLVVQDIFMHETAQIADVVLPATSFAEKDGTFTNSERRVQRVRKAVEPVGESKADWEIIRDVALRVSSKLGLELEHEFNYSHPSEIFDEMATLMPIIAGISYDRLEDEGGIQWPCPTPDHPGTRFLYESDFPRGTEGEVRGIRPGAGGGRDTVRQIPSDFEHWENPLPLARWNDHEARRQPVGSLARAHRRHEPLGWREVRHSRRRVDSGQIAARRPRGTDRLHGAAAHR